LREHKAELHYIGKESLLVWSQMSEEFENRLYTDYIDLISDVSSRAKDVGEAVRGVSTELLQLSEHINASAEGLRGLPDSISSETKEAFKGLNEESLKAWKEMSERYGRDVQSEFIKYTTALEEHAEKVATCMNEAAHELKRIGQSSDE